MRVDRLAYGGAGVGRLDGFVVFVEGTAPEETVRARIRRVRRRHAEAVVVAVEAASPARVEPRCPHVRDDCGGCRWQHVAYPAQAQAKAAIVRESLAHLGGFGDVPVAPILTPPEPWYYRNKMEFSFHPDGVLGLHRHGAWDRIVSLQTCFLQSPRAVALVHAARAFALEHGLSLYDPRTRQGFLRRLVVREGRRTGETMVVLVTRSGPFPQAQAFAERMVATDPSVVSVVRGTSDAPSDGAPLEAVEVLHGREAIAERVGELTFRIGPETFFQTSTWGAERLTELVLRFAEPARGGLVFDLYCGVGTFTLALAHLARHAAGVEVASAAVEAARQNAAHNGIGNATFHAGDVRLVLPALLEQLGTPQVIVLDPPRAGAGARVMRKIGRAGVLRVVYVSCNPTTLAPDLRELAAFGYRIAAVQPVDLFPQTYHVETVVALDHT